MNRQRILDLTIGISIGLLLGALIVLPLFSESNKMLDECLKTTEEIIQDWSETINLAEACINMLDEQSSQPYQQTPGTDSW